MPTKLRKVPLDNKAFPFDWCLPGESTMRFGMSKKYISQVILLSGAVLIAGCGGTVAFQGTQALSVTGTPPPRRRRPRRRRPLAPEPPPRVELRDNKIEINEKIQFEVNKATIMEASFSCSTTSGTSSRSDQRQEDLHRGSRERRGRQEPEQEALRRARQGRHEVPGRPRHRQRAPDGQGLRLEEADRRQRRPKRAARRTAASSSSSSSRT